MPPIHTAAINGDADALRRELESGVLPDTPDQFGFLPLHLVVSNEISAETDDVDSESDDTYTYIRKLRAAGSFQNYERAHLNAIVASFAPKFSHLLPPELVRRVVEYAFHVGDY